MDERAGMTQAQVAAAYRSRLVDAPRAAGKPVE